MTQLGFLYVGSFIISLTSQEMRLREILVLSNNYIFITTSLCDTSLYIANLVI